MPSIASMKNMMNSDSELHCIDTTVVVVGDQLTIDDTVQLFFFV